MIEDESVDKKNNNKKASCGMSTKRKEIKVALVFF
jgi:hypothetical protein